MTIPDSERGWGSAQSEIVETNIIAPRSFARFMNHYSKENNGVIKIDNPQGFIKMLLNTMHDEQKD